MKISLGTWRFFLAFLVVISHLWGRMIGGPAAYAVWGFFVLSGFLMTYVLRYKYGTSREGLTDYAFNRIVRIYPAYWVACIFGSITLLILPKLGIVLTSLNPQFVRPHGVADWLTNITLLPIFGGTNLLVPVAGALIVEVGVYVLVPLMAFSRLAAWLGLILSLVINYTYGFHATTFAIRYSTFLTCFWVFALGSLFCHYKDVLKKVEAPKLSVTIWLLHSVLWLWVDGWPWTYGIYFSAFLSGWVVISLAPIKSGRLDSILGDLSYPVYLFHTTVAVWVMLLLHKNQAHSFKLFIISFVITLFVSQFVIVTIDRYFKRLKKQVKNPSLEPQGGVSAQK